MAVTQLALGGGGRLGNKMFGISSTIGIAIKNDQKYGFDQWEYIDYFKNKLPVFDNTMAFVTIKEAMFGYTDYILPKQYNINLDGYFQSEKYWKHCENLIRYYFEPEKWIVVKLKALYHSIINTNTCSIHVRRGDYVNSPYHDVCDMGYYTRAIELIKSKATIDNFLVFSDDISWCRQNFPKEYLFIEGNEAIEDLFLMSFCKHNIIANSSFSWWGSYLSKNIDKIVIAPNKWFGEKGKNNHAGDLYLQNWITI